MDFDQIINSLSKLHNDLKGTLESLYEENDDLRDEISELETYIHDLESKIDEKDPYSNQYDVIEKLYYNKLSLSSSMFEYELDQFFRKILNKRL